MKERLAVNAASGVAMLASSVVIAFVLTPIMVGSLGNRDYGIWEVVLVLVGYVGLFDLGLGPALVRTFAYERARGEAGAVARAFTTAIVSLFLVGLLAFGVMALFSWSPEVVVNLERGSIPQLGTVFLLVGGNLLVKFPGTVLTAYLLGTQRHYVMNTVRIVSALAQAVAIAYALTSLEGSGLVWLAGIHLGFSLAEHVVYAFYLFVGEPELRPSRDRFSRKTLGELVRFGAKSLLGLLSSRLRIQAIPLVISQVLGVERVVFFAIAQRLAEYALQLGMSVARPLAPYFSDLHGRKDPAGMRWAWFRTSRMLQFLYCGMGVGILFLGEPFIARWMGVEYARESRIVLRFTASVMFFEALAPNAHMVLVGMNRHGRAGGWLLLCAVGGISLAVALGSRFALEGVAAGYALGSLFASMGLLVLACRAIEIPVWDHARETLLPLVPALLLEVGVLGGLIHVLGPPATYAQILWVALAGGATYAATWWLWTLNDEERGMLSTVMEAPLRRLR